MKAWVLHNIGDLRYEEIGEPKLSDKEVLVSVKAAGICGSDIPRIYTNGAHTMPLIPGHEFSGEVVKVSENADKRWMGKRVAIFPLLPCGACEPCKQHKYEMCRQYSYLGSRRNGAFAEYVAVPEWNLIELSEKISFEEAAMLEPMAVAVHAMRQVEMSKNDTVVVYGLGTIGQLLLMFLMEKGIPNIFAIGNKEYQKDIVIKMGLPEHNYCNSRLKDVKEWLLSRTNGYGADVLFECVGNNASVTQVVDLSAPSGRVCMVGNPHSDMTLSRDTYWKILRNQLTITGTWNSSYTGQPEDDWHYVLQKLKQRKIRPESIISHRYSLEEMENGLDIMHHKRDNYIKVMIISK